MFLLTTDNCSSPANENAAREGIAKGQEAVQKRTGQDLLKHADIV